MSRIVRRTSETVLSRRAAAGLLVLLQLAVAAALGRGQGWPGSSGDRALAAVLLAVQMVLLYAVADRIGGRRYALAAGLVLALAPALLAKWYFITGGPNLDFKTVYRHQVLPTEYGLADRPQLVAACLVLAAIWLALARAPTTVWAAIASAGAIGGAVLLSPRTWPALAAPVLAAATTRRAAPIAAGVATAGAALVVLALARHVPHIPLGWHRMGLALGGLHEYAWSRRILEYLPLAGVVGVARRSATAGLFVGMLFLSLVVFPLARPIFLTGYLEAMVPALPVYFLLAASIGFLWPRRVSQPAPAGAHVTSRQ